MVGERFIRQLQETLTPTRSEHAQLNQVEREDVLPIPAPPITHEEIDAQFSAYNESIKSTNNNGTGEMLFKFADPESLSEHPLFTPLGRPLIQNNGRAPLEQVAEETGFPVEELKRLPETMSNIVEVNINDEGVEEIALPPLTEYIEEKREFLEQRGDIFELGKRAAD